MGERTSFYKILSIPTLKSLIIENYGAFREWCLNAHISSSRSGYVKHFLRENVFPGFDSMNQEQAGELVYLFVCGYCISDIDGKTLIEEIGSSIYTRHYDNCTALIDGTQDSELLSLWDILRNGRSITGEGWFNAYTGGIKIGWLSGVEQNALKEKINRYFGGIETIRQNYREPEEEGSDYSIGEPLEVVLWALREADNGNDLIITIEGW